MIIKKTPNLFKGLKMRSIIAKLFIQFALGFVIPNTLDAGDLEHGWTASDEAVRWQIGEIFVYQTVRCHNCLIGNHSALGYGGAIAHPDVTHQMYRLGKWRHFAILVQIPGIVETAVNNLDIPSHAHIVTYGDFVKAEDLEVGATVSAASAEGKGGIIRHQQIGAERELHRAAEDKSAVDCPNGTLHRGGDV